MGRFFKYIVADKKLDPVKNDVKTFALDRSKK